VITIGVVSSKKLAVRAAEDALNELSPDSSGLVWHRANKHEGEAWKGAGVAVYRMCFTNKIDLSGIAELREEIGED
jgi:hypothetical protein